jgi:APA family basic amino acid/polyamine antiporter
LQESTVAHGLVRGITRVHLVALLINGIVGAGILGLPSRAFALSGTYSLLAWLVCAVVVSGIGLCLAEVSSRYRDSGGPYLYALSAFGPAIGFMTGWLTWVSRVVALATICALVVDYAGALAGEAVTGTARIALLTALLGGLALVQLTGIRQTAWTSTLLTFAKLALLVAFIVAGLLLQGATVWPAVPPPSFRDFAATVAVLLFAFFGFENGTITTGETADPQRRMPLAIFASIGVATACYVLVQYVSIVGLPGLAQSQRPVADLSARLFGPAAAVFVAGGAIVMMLGTMFVVLLGASRMLMAMAEQAQLPAALARLHPRFRTPVTSILISMAAGLAAAVFSTFTSAVVVTVTTRVLTYVVICAALPVLRRRPDAVKPLFRVPFGTGVAALSALVSAALIVTSTLTEIVTTLVLAAVGWAVWLVVEHQGAVHRKAAFRPSR